MDTETTHQQRGDGRLTVAALTNELARRRSAGPSPLLSQASGDQDRRRRRQIALRCAMQALV